MNASAIAALTASRYTSSSCGGSDMTARLARRSRIAAAASAGRSIPAICASSALPKLDSMTMPSTEIASSVATRGTALLMPEAVPAWSWSTAFITVVVSGATMTAMPRPRAVAAGDQGGAGPVKGVRLPVPTLRQPRGGDRQDNERHGDISEKDPAPRQRIDEPAAEDRAGRSGQRRKAGPQSDCAPADVGGKGRADQRQAAGDEERAAQALQRARCDQVPDGWREPAPERCQREDRDASGGHPHAAEPIAERAAGKDQRREHQRVGLDDPLHLDYGGAKARLQCRQGDVSARGIDEGEARPEDRRCEHPFPLALGAGRVGRPGANDALIAWFACRRWPSPILKPRERAFRRQLTAAVRNHEGGQYVARCDRSIGIPEL